MSNSNRVVSRFAVWLTLAALGVGGCYAHASTEPVWVEAEYTPARIEVYPHTVYEGRTVYLVNDHWYTRERGRWVYYRVEPEPLYRQRAIVQKAPPAPHRHGRPRVVHERRGEREHRHHREADRVRERHHVHEAPPAMHR